MQNVILGVLCFLKKPTWPVRRQTYSYLRNFSVREFRKGKKSCMGVSSHGKLIILFHFLAVINLISLHNFSLFIEGVEGPS